MPLSHFSTLTQSSADRNLVNLVELDAWLDAIGKAKLGAGDRADKARGWLSTVGKQFMKRHGQLLAVSPERANALSSEHAWAAKAIASGATLQELALDDAEAEELNSILDWMRSGEGPSPASDWSRISWPQAHGAHEKWIEQISKAAQKHMDQSKAFDGCQRACEVHGQPHLAGWSWVKVLSAEALNREGALMRHCVGSYAQAVQDDDLQIWSLRDPEGKPHMTVETTPAYEALENGQEDDDADPKLCGVTISQAKSFGNSPPKEAHRLAIASLFSHLEAIGSPAVAGSPDLFRSGLGISPEGLGPRRLWSRGSLADAADALSRVSLLGPKATMAEASELAKTFATLQYVDAIKALAVDVRGMAMDEASFADIKVQAGKVGIFFGISALGGAVIDRASEADALLLQKACENLLAMPSSNEREASLVELATYFAEEGFLSHFAILAPALLEPLSLPESQSALSEIRDGLLAAPNPCFFPVLLPPSPLTRHPLWTSSKSLSADALSAAIEIRDNPKFSAEARTALSIFAKLGHFEAAAALSGAIFTNPSFISCRTREDLELISVIQDSGLAVLLNMPESGAQDIKLDRIWTPMSSDAHDALLLARADPRGQNPILPVAIKMGYEQAVAAIAAHVGDVEAYDLSLAFMDQKIDAAAFGIRASTSRSELQALRKASLSRGFVAGALASLDALAKLPDESFDSIEQAEAHRASYPRWKAVISDMVAAIQDIAQSPAICRELVKAERQSGASRLQTSVAWEAVAVKFNESHHDSLRQFSSFLRSALVQSVPSISDIAPLSLGAVRRARGPGLCSSAASSISFYLAQGLSHVQRQALLQGIFGLPAQQATPVMKTKLADRREPLDAKESSANFRPSPPRS